MASIRRGGSMLVASRHSNDSGSMSTAIVPSASRSPRAVAADVARHAKRILEGDKDGRRSLYEKRGLPKDKSVE